MKNNLLVSVVIPFYNQKFWLEQAVDSVLKQTHQFFEIIIVNDGSLESIKDIDNKDKRIRMIEKKNGGPASARNLGMKLSNGDYIAFLDSDDIWLPNKLEVQLNFMIDNNVSWSQHNYYYMYKNDLKNLKKLNTKFYSGDVSTQLFTSFKVQTSTVMVKRKVLFDANNKLIITFREDARYGQDMYFYLELAKKFKLAHINEYLSYFRIRNGNAGFKGTIQIDARQMLWNSLKNENELYKQTNFFTKSGYRINNIIYSVAQKIYIGDKIGKLLSFIPKIFFKVAFIYETIAKKQNL
ncbi:glycosyltransferase family 2 protein [Enterococcus durans]|uniref:glycosyltransferase family 2 protein n=1 Tax=Enterococcus durans TaxID=53345 RepID=UPI0014313EB2|nr:glycosyltransferase family 2 protein [Enterococcus durans]NJE62845.1 glycosyltransferase family 2 protein [Enterococcus durans]